MSTTVTCPRCNAALRSNKPLVAKKTLRCPSCGEQFQAVPEEIQIAPDATFGTPDLPELAPPLPPPITPAISLQSNLPLIVFISSLGVVLAGSIGLVVWLNAQDHQRKPKQAVLAETGSDKQPRLEDEKKRLHEREKQLQEEKDRLEQEKRKLDSDKHLADTQAALAKKQLDEAEKVTARDTQQKQNRQKEFDQLMQMGKEKMSAKDYDAAVTAFQSAVDLIADRDAIAALAEARQAGASSKEQQEKLKKYNDLIVAAGKAMQFGLLDDAQTKYQAALDLIPNDPIATQGLRLARQRKDAVANAENKRQGAGQDLTMARTALGNMRFDEALAAVDRALKMSPGDQDALALKQQIAIKQAEIRLEYTRLMLLAQGAYQANRIAEAQNYFLQLNRVFPGDPLTALALDMTVANQWNYVSNLNLGYLALQQNRAQDAVRYFAAALLAFPRDPSAVAALAQAERALDKQNPQRGNLQDIVKAANQAMQMRQWKEAIRLWEAARDQSPLDALVRTNLARARYELAMDSGRAAMTARQFATAVTYFQEALLQQPGDFTANNMKQQATALAQTQPQQPVQVPQVQPKQPAPQPNPNKGKP